MHSQPFLADLARDHCQCALPPLRSGRSRRGTVESHRRSPRANAREDAVHLENEALTVEDRRQEEKSL
jgi:hypothetical protein